MTCIAAIPRHDKTDPGYHETRDAPLNDILTQRAHLGFIHKVRWRTRAATQKTSRHNTKPRSPRHVWPPTHAARNDNTNLGSTWCSRLPALFMITQTLGHHETHGPPPKSR